MRNKKVLLRERKRHTDRGVSSTPSVILYEVGYPPPQPGLTEGVPPHWGTPPGQVLGGVTRPPPGLDLAGVPPPPPGPGWGTPPPPPGVDRHVSKHYLPIVLRTRSVINVEFVFQFFYAIASSKSSNVIVLGLAQIMVSMKIYLAYRLISYKLVILTKTEIVCISFCIVVQNVNCLR